MSKEKLSKLLEGTKEVLDEIEMTQSMTKTNKAIKELGSSRKKGQLPSKDKQKELLKLTCESAILVIKDYDLCYKMMVTDYPQEKFRSPENYLTREEVKEIFEDCYTEYKLKQQNVI